MTAGEDLDLGHLLARALTHSGTALVSAAAAAACLLLAALPLWHMFYICDGWGGSGSGASAGASADSFGDGFGECCCCCLLSVALPMWHGHVCCDFMLLMSMYFLLVSMSKCCICAWVFHMHRCGCNID
jgi:hypothetical protein